MTSTSYKLEHALWSSGTDQRITWFWKLSIDHNMMSYIKNYTVKRGCISLSTYYLEDGRHLARIHRRRRRRRRRRRAYASTSNTASHDNHEKINSWVSFCFPYMGCLWGSAWQPFGLLFECSLIYRNQKFMSDGKTDIGESVHKTFTLGCKLWPRKQRLYERFTSTSF